MVSLRVATKASLVKILPSILATEWISLQGTPVDVDHLDGSTLPDSSASIEYKGSGSETPILDDAVLFDLLKLLPTSPNDSESRIEESIERSKALSPLDFKALQQPIKELDAHLTLRSFIVGYRFSLADLVMWATIRGNRLAVPIIATWPNVKRWYEYIEASNPWIDEAIAKLYATLNRFKQASVGANAVAEIAAKGEKGGAVVTRFPPEPSGYLHIGHAKAAILNEMLAHDQPNGILVVRFDDTNPSKESQEFQDSILHDLEAIGIKPEKVTYSSNYFDQMYEACKKMISEGKAYADDTEGQVMKEERGAGIASKRRDMSPQDTLKHFEEMKSGSAEGQKWCIRAKISVDDVNKALRDPVVYRCNLLPHHRTGSKWKIYPTYDLCVSFVDALEGITLALRTTEYNDRNPQYVWFQKAMGVRTVPVWEFSRLSFIRTVLSKRKLTEIVKMGAVRGWDDPRMPTIRGMLRRGVVPAALREFVRGQGPSRNVVAMDWSTFWATNKKHIDPVAPRYTAVLADDMVTARVTGAGGVRIEDKPKHLKNPALGSKKVVYSDTIVLDQEDARSFETGEEITLMNWGNAFVRRIDRDGDKVTGLELELHLEGNFKTTSKKITWLSSSSSGEGPQNLIPVKLHEFDHLITKDKLEKDEVLTDFLNPKTEVVASAVADCNVADLRAGDIVQFERKGFFRIDRAYGKKKDGDGDGDGGDEGDAAHCFKIPTGRES